MQWVDVTIPMAEGMIVWPGDPAFTFKKDSRIAEGDSANVSFIGMSTHTGTHVDAPWHFEDRGKRLHEVDSQLFFGDAHVIEVPGVDIVTAADLGDTALPPRVLVKTRNSARDAALAFDTHYVALAEDAAERLVEDGVRLIGVDYLSVAPYKQPGQTTHHILLQAEVLIVEGLRLAEVPAGRHPFVILPLPLYDADGAPCRAFVGIETVQGDHP